MLEVVVGDPQAFFEIYFWLPLQDAAGFCDVRAALLGIVLRQRMKNDRSGCADERAHALGKFENRDFVRVADVDGLVLVRFEQPVNSFDQIGDVAKTSRLLAVAVRR